MPVFPHFTDNLLICWQDAIKQKIIPDRKKRSDYLYLFNRFICNGIIAKLEFAIG